MLDLLPSFQRVESWHWWILGGLLLLLELISPGSFFVWIAASAFLMGLVVFVLPIPVAGQLLLFAILSVVVLYAGRRYVGHLRRGAAPEADLLNRKGAAYVGQRFTLVEGIVNGKGRVRVGDGTWIARGPDLPTGTTVQVIGVEGTTLLVEPAEEARLPV